MIGENRKVFVGFHNPKVLRDAIERRFRVVVGKEARVHSDEE
jgi:hypothetical protein